MNALAPIPLQAGITNSGIYYEVHGAGAPLFLSFPVTASADAVPSIGGESIAHGYLSRLTDRYRVLVADYPSVGRSKTIPTSEFTVARVCGDLLEIADAAGFSRFAWWGGTFGAIAGLQLATRTDRLTAVVSAGWPPLGAPYATMLKGTRVNATNPPAHARAILRDAAQYAQWVTFYESLAGFSEAAAVARIACPRLVVVGALSESDVAGIPLRLAATIRENRSDLETLGWEVIEVPGQDDSLILEPQTLVPIVRGFLDRLV